MLQKSQQIQEDEYFLPYHWSFDRSTYGGRVYFGYLDICLSFLGKNKQIKILDAGCGDGRFLHELKRVGIQKIYGVDYSSRAISYAQTLVPEANVSVADLAELPYENNLFDIIFLVEVLEHIKPQEIDKLLLSLKRVLKPGGELVITTPSINTPPPEKHFQHFSERSLGNVIIPHFTTFEMQGQDKIGFSLLKLLYKFLDNRFWLLRKLTRFYNLHIWPKYFNRCDAANGNRIIVRCRK